MLSDLKDVNESLKAENMKSNSNSPAAMTLLKLLSKNETKFLLAHATSGL